MAEPVSIIASAITIIEASNKLGNLIHSIIKLKDADQVVAEVKDHIKQMRKLVHYAKHEHGGTDSLPEDCNDMIAWTIKPIEDKLAELDKIILKVVKRGTGKVDKTQWLRYQGKVKGLLEKIQSKFGAVTVVATLSTSKQVRLSTRKIIGKQDGDVEIVQQRPEYASGQTTAVDYIRDTDSGSAIQIDSIHTDSEYASGQIIAFDHRHNHESNSGIVTQIDSMTRTPSIPTDSFNILHRCSLDCIQWCFTTLQGSKMYAMPSANHNSVLQDHSSDLDLHKGSRRFGFIRSKERAFSSTYTLPLYQTLYCPYLRVSQSRRLRGHPNGIQSG
ncbi:hypothetical protein BDV95DRAFT_220462 [Massariosphaeria phaeospora]|uniref:Fungal N-terminal domain-containing protein n=1 Tax=Massariosphaeria phaeospora TaxID=100035 RepID=A0A7C8ME88_9PLEO|nr:hypothetical protein BDV95DRAFT_220462 [Massariosphaeria phaeospora]